MPVPRQVAAVSAAATAILVFAGQGFASDGPNEATASAQQITRFVDDSAGSVRISLCLTALAAAALLVFGAAMTAQLRAAGAELAARIATCAATSTATLLAASAVRTPLVREDPTGASDTWLQSVYALNDLSDALGDIAVVTAAVLVASLALPALRGVGLPRALGIAGAILAVAGGVAALAPLDGVEDGPFTVALAAFYVLWPLWLLAVGVAFALRAPAKGYPSGPGYQQAAV